MKKLKLLGLLLLISSTVSYSCKEEILDFENDLLPAVNTTALKDNARHVLKDEHGIAYLRISIDNRPHCSLIRNNKLNFDKNEMELFAQNILLDLESTRHEFPHFEYVVIHIFDHDTKDILNTYIQ